MDAPDQLQEEVVFVVISENYILMKFITNCSLKRLWKRGRFFCAISGQDERNAAISIRIIEQLIDNIPEGDFQAKTKAVLKLPKGEFYSRVETARGEFGVYIVSEGGTTPYRIKFRSPGFSNLSALDHMAKGLKIGDLVAMMGTLDLVIPDIDR